MPLSHHVPTPELLTPKQRTRQHTSLLRAKHDMTCGVVATPRDSASQPTRRYEGLPGCHTLRSSLGHNVGGVRRVRVGRPRALVAVTLRPTCVRACVRANYNPRYLNSDTSAIGCGCGVLQVDPYTACSSTPMWHTCQHSLPSPFFTACVCQLFGNCCMRACEVPTKVRSSAYNTHDRRGPAESWDGAPNSTPNARPSPWSSAKLCHL
jgi:hypothetical protein